ADLRGVQMKLLGERLRGNRADPRAVELVQAAQVDRQAVRGELGNLLDALLGDGPFGRDLVRSFHKPWRDFSKKPPCYNPPPMATSAPRSPIAKAGFEPYVPPSQSPAEFTLKAIVIGAIFGLIFGASTVYLGLRAGLTVSASIPIAVLAISVLKKL